MTTQTSEKGVQSTVVSRPHAKTIAVEKLTVYPEVQRIPPTAKLVAEIADKLDISALGTFHVSERADGTFSLLDGQRRKKALESRGMGSFRVNALIYQGLSVAQEAQMFRMLNRSRLVGAFDDFEKGVVAGDERDAGVQRVMKKGQWEIGRSNKPGICSCVISLRRVWDIDGNGALLTRTVTVLDAAFGRDKNTMAGSLVDGVARFLSGRAVDLDVMAEKLRSRFPTPLALISAARARCDVDGGALYSNVQKVVERVYEARKKSAR